MRTGIAVFGVILGLAVSSCAQQSPVEQPEPPQYTGEVKRSSPYEGGNDEALKITPRFDKDDPNKLYIPNNLEDALVELANMLHPKFIQKLKDGGEEERVKQHFGLGLWMRNNWGLWGSSNLAKSFNSIGIFHPDDMSAIILTSFQRKLNDQPIMLEEQVKRYLEFWEKQKKNDAPKKVVRGKRQTQQ